MSNPIQEKHNYQLRLIRELRRLPTIPENCYPKTGRVVETESGDIIAFGYIYTTNSSIGWLEWVTTNPTYSAQARHEALEELIPDLLKQGKELGASVVFTSVKEPSLINRYKKFGAIPGDQAATNMIWNLGD